MPVGGGPDAGGEAGHGEQPGGRRTGAARQAAGQQRGAAAGAGPYTISVAASDASGVVVKARNLAWAGVSSVMPNGGKPTLTLSDGSQVAADTVRKIA